MNIKKLGIFIVIAIIGITAIVLYKRYLKVAALYSKPTWSVTIDKNSPKAANEYDIIVVGAGLGGLTAAALLAQENYKVLVLEQSNRVGGYAREIDIDGYKAFYGAEDVTGTWEGGCVNYLVKKLGYNPASLFIPASRRIVLDSKVLDITPQADSAEKALIELFPSQAQQIHDFLQDARLAYQELNNPVIINRYGIIVDKNTVAHALSAQELAACKVPTPHLASWQKMSFQEKLDYYFTDPDLKYFMSSYLGYIGASRQIPANVVLGASLVYFFKTAAYIKGGPQALADLLADYVTKHGGSVQCNTKVDKIDVSHQQITGVHAGSTYYKAPVVIANVNAKTVYTKLIDANQLDQRFLNMINNIKMGMSVGMVNLGVDMDLSMYPIFMQNLKEHIHVIIRTNADSSLAPQGKASVSLLFKGNYQDYPKPEDPTYQDFVQKVSQEEIKKTETMIPDLHNHIVAINYVTPYTLEREFLMPEGAAYGFDARSGVQLSRKSPIKGLYLASASVRFGGVESVVKSGIWVKHDIMNWK